MCVYHQNPHAFAKNKPRKLFAQSVFTANENFSGGTSENRTAIRKTIGFYWLLSASIGLF
jgi:hypothetical protein